MPTTRANLIQLDVTEQLMAAICVSAGSLFALMMATAQVPFRPRTEYWSVESIAALALIFSQVLLVVFLCRHWPAISSVTLSYRPNRFENGRLFFEVLARNLFSFGLYSLLHFGVNELGRLSMLRQSPPWPIMLLTLIGSSTILCLNQALKLRLGHPSLDSRNPAPTPQTVSWKRRIVVLLVCAGLAFVLRRGASWVIERYGISGSVLESFLLAATIVIPWVLFAWVLDHRRVHSE